MAQLAGYVAEHTAYHHGEESLHGTIVNMAQDFVGTNNLPLLLPSGQFGTRSVLLSSPFSLSFVFLPSPSSAYHTTRTRCEKILSTWLSIMGSSFLPSSGQLRTRPPLYALSLFFLSVLLAFFDASCYRLQGGKDAASARYIFTRLAPLTRTLFPDLDDPILNYLEEDGDRIQPEYFVSWLDMSDLIPELTFLFFSFSFSFH